MEINGIEAKKAFVIKGVDSIPCDVKGQIIAFDAQANIISEPLKSPWPMPWITEEIKKLVVGERSMPDKKRFRVNNPEEPDQFVLIEVQE